MTTLRKQDAATPPENSTTDLFGTQTKRCNGCKKAKPIDDFKDEKGIIRASCLECLRYQRNWMKNHGGHTREKAKRNRRFAKVPPPGQKVCHQCMNLRPTGDFIRKDGKESNKCKACRQYAVDWDSAHRKKRNADAKSRRVRYRGTKEAQRYRNIVLDAYGRFCACCGETIEEFLVIDHINGGGTQERKKVGFGTKFYKWLIRRGFPSGYRTLCHNCNMSTRFKYPCAHELERKALPILDQPIPGFEFLGGAPNFPLAPVAGAG